MSLLDSVYSPADVKKLRADELPVLCDDIRRFLIEHVSKTGGHLASNLGAVELTVALHRVFNTETDRLLFDVGHQCYVHKILTNRKEQFNSLRQYGGLAGFPKPSESIHDAYIAGHASDSISIALGMARACKLTGDSFRVICVVGDGSLTGGMASEALFDLGNSGLPVTVILNDNGMSINPNTGGMGKYLKRLRLKPSYLKLKQRYRSVLKKIPGGKAIYRLSHSLKERLKASVLNASMFEEMGLEYGGPIDGHDFDQLIEVLNWSKEQTGPTLVHVITKKGKGYAFAEANAGKYHGIGPFNPLTGEVLSSAIDFSAVFGDEMCRLARADSRICAITAAMTSGTGLQGFAAAFPDRFFDVGITEEHAAAMAGGMADRGLLPVFAVYSTFLQRSYDMLFHDIALGKEHVVLAVDRSGLVGADGETHHGLFDVSYLTSIPEFTVYSPASFAELRQMLKTALYDERGPVAVRYPRGGEGSYTGCTAGPLARLQSGKKIQLLSYGPTVNLLTEAADTLATEGIEAGILKLNRLSPLPEDELTEELTDCRLLVCVEETTQNGCIGQQVAALLTKRANAPIIVMLNTGNRFISHGSVSQLREECGLTADNIVSVVKENC